MLAGNLLYDLTIVYLDVTLGFPLSVCNNKYYSDLLEWPKLEVHTYNTIELNILDVI